jgi:hypothetical protein
MSLKFYIFILAILILPSCRHHEISDPLEWSKNIKQHILSDVDVTVDRVVTDTTSMNSIRLTLFHNERRTKQFVIRKGDTLASFFYSPTQEFELVRELCPAISRSFEGIKYKGKACGLAEFRFCDGTLMRQGFRFDGDVGVWKEWDSTGKLIGTTDYGDSARLAGLRKINYQ